MEERSFRKRIQVLGLYSHSLPIYISMANYQQSQEINYRLIGNRHTNPWASLKKFNHSGDILFRYCFFSITNLFLVLFFLSRFDNSFFQILHINCVTLQNQKIPDTRKVRKIHRKELILDNHASVFVKTQFVLLVMWICAVFF